MKTKIISTILAAAMLITLSFTTIFAVETANAEEDTLQFEVLDENGNVEEVLEFSLADTYYIDEEDVENGIMPQSLVTPNPNTNYYDLSNGTYVLYTGASQTVYEMDKWFYSNSNGDIYVSAYVVDADATLKFYRYNFDDSTHFWKIHEYELQINGTNPRAREYKGRVHVGNVGSQIYYTFLVHSTGDSFTGGVLKASWSPISDPHDINP